MAKGAGGESHQTAIVLDDSDEEVQVSSAASPVQKRPSTKDEHGAAEAGPSSISLIGNRAQMERERLARQRKRRREAGLDDEDVEADDKRLRGEQATLYDVQLDGQQIKATANTKTRVTGTSVPMYWNGAIRKSYNRHAAADAKGAPFEDYLRPTTPFHANGLTHAIMATYCEDLQWLAVMFPKGQGAPEITMITLAQGDLKPGVYAPLHPQLPNWIRLVISRKGLNEYTTMHMKFMMLFYEDRLRLLILSGNMVGYDWSSIENTAFIHDFPRLAEGQRDTTSEYGAQMKRVLSSLSVPSGHHAMRMMDRYDMRSQSEARIVFSIPTFTPIVGWPAIEELGLGRLARLAREILGGKTTKVQVEAQGSSMGTYSPRWLQQLHIVCSGADYRTCLPLPVGAKACKAWATATGYSESQNWPPIRLLFPSDRWVKREAVEGVAGALTFFGKKRASIEKGFVQLLHQPVSVRAKVMMHHKAILCLADRFERDPSTVQDPQQIIGWAYAGSHNLTQAAWGNISMPKKGNQVQLTINNWELGVVVPVRPVDLTEAARGLPSSMAANVITWKRPVNKYANDDVPWDQFDQ